MTVWSRHGLTLAWRADEFGKPDLALYLGELCVGLIHPWGVPNYRPGQTRAWIMNEPDGSELGWYPTEQEAKDALVQAVLKALFGEAE